MAGREHRQRRINAHCTGSLAAGSRHIQDGHPVILIVVTESLHQPHSLFRRVSLHLFVRDFQILQLHHVLIQPLAVRLIIRVF